MLYILSVLTRLKYAVAKKKNKTVDDVFSSKIKSITFAQHDEGKLYLREEIKITAGRNRKILIIWNQDSISLS